MDEGAKVLLTGTAIATVLSLIVAVAIFIAVRTRA